MIDLEAEMIAETVTHAVVETVERVIKRIAPSWPLDQFIAVNPYWGFRDQPIVEAARQLKHLSGSPLLMPRKFYQQRLALGELRREHLHDALTTENNAYSVEDLLEHVHRITTDGQTPLITDLVDQQRDLLHGMSVHDFVIHNVSQHCAAYFDQLQAVWRPVPESGLYADWLRHATADYSPRLLMGLKGIRSRASSLPHDPIALISTVLKGMHLSEGCWDAYLTALLLSINGWASWCANRRWQANLVAQDDDSMVQLLAIRLAWEWLLLKGQYADRIDAHWVRLWEKDPMPPAARKDDELDWLLQSALERAYQKPLCASLVQTLSVALELEVPRSAVQAVFCIDVRSEVFRRALEANGSEIHTLGFAGFFGLPISYEPLGTRMSRPQLPGLLAPSLCVTEQSDSRKMDQILVRRRRQRLQATQVWKSFGSFATSTFSFVECFGLAYAGKLWKASLPRHEVTPKSDEKGLSLEERSHLRPELQNISLRQQCDLAGGVLKGMSLMEDFARIVLLAGHGSRSANNAHASGLDCGACCGQTGEVNARALAALLNQLDVRAGLIERGIVIPEDTWFVAALHNTTTDEMELFDMDQLPPTHTADLVQLRTWLNAAGDRARAERAASLGIKRSPSPNSLKEALQVRANDWSQVRPEWGLANNASFIIAPRSRTRHIDLKGRAFLHEYDFARDIDHSTLEAIMTAPMLVTNWINMQYYASTVDNSAFGSGNKVLHNVVGGRLGVFEGNGGDLRIGLPLQSLHDGQHLRHTPLRLSVFIEASQSAIAAIVDKHQVVKELVDHAWLHLFQVEPGGSSVFRYSRGVWLNEISGA